MTKTAFITGAGGYIGTQTALTLAKEGLNIAVCDINGAAVNAAVKKIVSSGGNAKGYISDVTDPISIESAIKKAAVLTF